MSTFSQDKTNAKAVAASVDKDNPTKEDIQAAEDAATEQGEVPSNNPNEPTSILDESASETADRHIASTELPVGDVTDPDTQADTFDAADAKEKIVPGAAEGPYADGTVVNDQGRVAYAKPGSHNAAMAGVQEDASGHVDSVGTDNSSKSGTRI